MRYKMLTENGYDFYEIASLLQKAIRRGDYRKAGFATNELCNKYRKYLWKRLLVISAEDCYGVITREIVGLKIADDETGKKDNIYFAKAVTLLCQARKNRDACFLACNYMWEDRTLNLDEIHEECDIEECERPNRLPDYVFDVHTLKGKMRGKTIRDMIKDEQEALYPKQIGLFDYESWDTFLLREGK